MTDIAVSLKDNAYKILTGNGALATLSGRFLQLAVGTHAVVITNPQVRALHGSVLRRVLAAGGCKTIFLEVADSESSKSAVVAFELIEKIVSLSVGKKIFIVAFGGGVVGDLAGFVAAILRRGVPFVQVPTTLLAQIDSSIGGKVAVDLPAGKNLAGTFYQPKIVVCDPLFLLTLPDRQIRNGLAEAVKYGAIRDEKLFSFIEAHYEDLLAKNEKALQQVVSGCAKIKADIVARDEKETRGIRTMLNFGHTLGHAIEAAGGFERYQHGEAVALGMRIAALISYRMKILEGTEVARINCLLTALGLPQSIEDLEPQRILSAMSHDKKFSGRINRFVLLKRIGKAVVESDIPLKLIHKSLQEHCL